MAVKKIEELNIHRDVNSTEQFDVQGYLNENWDKMQDVVDNNAEELMQVQKDISTLKEDNKTNKSSIDVLEKSNETRDKKISKNAEDIEAIQESIKTATETINKKDNAQDDSIMAIQENIETINSKNEEQDSAISDNATSIKNLQAKNVEINAENERLREDIKSIALPGEASGENIHLEDSSNARCEIEIGGNQKQDTREGYNLLIPPASKTENGITFTTNEDGSVTVNGTATADASINFLNKEGSHFFSFEAGTYKLTGCPKGGSKTTYSLGMNIANTTFDIGEGATSTINADVTGKVIWLAISAGVTVNNLIFYPMLIKGTENKPFEQYGASPSPDYPSEIQTVGSVKNILDMSNAKGGTSGGITCTMNKDGSYTYKGTAASQYINVWFMGGYATNLPTLFTLEPGTYYINDVSLFEGTTGFANDSSKKIWTFIRAYNVTGVRAPNAVSGNTYDETKYPIIAKIDHEIPWVPYNYGSAKIDIFNKNYLSKIPKTSVTAQGITSTFDGEKFICKGTAQTNYFNLFYEKVYKKIGKGIKTLSTNKLKKGRVFIHFDYVDGTSQNYYTSINTNQFRFALNKDVKSYRLNVDSITAGDTIDDNIYVQLEDGNIATEIEKAENQEYLIDVQQPMFEGDKFVKTDGKWYEKHCWKKMLLNGTEKAGVSGASTNEILAIVYDINNAVDGFGYSNYFLYSSQVELNKMSVYNGGKSLRVNVSKMQFADLESFKAKLKELYEAGTPVIIYYKLAKPELIECTEAKSKVLDEIYNKAHTYKNITNISAESAEVNPIINVKYLKDTETEHNKLQAQIDEIKQLLSSTETSAMLLNNMQTDLESEV